MASANAREAIIIKFNSIYHEIPVSKIRYAEIVFGSRVYSVIAKYAGGSGKDLDYEIFDRREFYPRLIAKIAHVLTPQFETYTDGEYTVSVKLDENTFTVDFYLKKDSKEAIVIQNVGC